MPLERLDEPLKFNHGNLGLVNEAGQILHFFRQRIGNFRHAYRPGFDVRGCGVEIRGHGLKLAHGEVGARKKLLSLSGQFRIGQESTDGALSLFQTFGEPVPPGKQPA